MTNKYIEKNKMWIINGLPREGQRTMFGKLKTVMCAIDCMLKDFAQSIENQPHPIPTWEPWQVTISYYRGNRLHIVAIRDYYNRPIETFKKQKTQSKHPEDFIMVYEHLGMCGCYYPWEVEA